MDGFGRDPAQLGHWGATRPHGRIGIPGGDIVGSLVFSADGARAMARFSDETFRICHSGDEAPTVVLTDQALPGAGIHTEGFNTDYDFSPDGRLFALGLSPRGVAIHRTEDGRELLRWAGGEPFNRLAWSPDGLHIAAARTARTDVRELSLLRASDLTLLRAVELPAAANAMAWSPDGRLLAVTLTDNTLLIYDARAVRKADRFTLGVRDPTELTWAGGSAYVASGGGHGRVSLINAQTGREEILLEDSSPSSLRAAAALNQAEGLRLASMHGVMTRWHVLPPVGWQAIPPGRPNGYTDAFNNACLDFTPDGRRAVSGHGRFVIVRDVASGRQLGELEFPDRHILELSTVAFADSGRTLLHCSSTNGLAAIPLLEQDDGSVRFGPPAVLDPEPGFGLTDHTADGQRLVLANNETGTLKVVEVTGTSIKPLCRSTADGIYAGAISPDGTTLLVTCSGAGPNAASQRNTVQRADGTPVRELPGLASGEAAWCADGRIAMTSNGPEENVLWNTSNWEAIAHVKGRLAGNASTFALAPDGSVAVIVTPTGIHLISTADGSRLATVEAPGASGIAASVRFLPGSQRFGVLWRDGRLDLIDVAALRAGLKPLGLAW